MDDTIAARILFPLLMFTLLCAAAAAREVPLPEEEAAPALFSTQLGDAEAQLFLEGRWRSDLRAGFGYTYDERTRELYPSTLPQLSEGIAFSQSPNLTLSLWLKERFFFETIITEDQQLETFLFGYNGDEGDPVEKVRVGNSDLGMGDFGYLSLPAASSDSFGAYGLFNGGSSTHHLALRFDPAGKAHKAYLGRNLIEEQRFDPQQYVRRRFYILPDAGVENLRVYMEDPQGTYSVSGTRFKELGAEEVSVSAAEGLVYLQAPADGQLAVYYEKDGSPVGDSLLGAGALAGTSGGRIDLEQPAVDFEWNLTYLGIDFDTERQVTIDGNASLLLHVPGTWSPFELQSIYRPENRPDDPDKLRVSLVQKEARSGERLSYLLFQEEFIRLAAGSSLRDPLARYPLAEYTEEGAYYGPEAGGIDPDPLRQLLIQRLSPVSGYLQEESALPGSIEVLRDGRQVSAFSFDQATGEVSFFYPVGDNERVDIYYRSPDAASAGSGDLLLASANRFTFSDTLSANFDFGLRWNAGGESFTVEQSEAQGSILATAGLEYEGEGFGAALQGALGVHNPNTTGYRRLLGMGERGIPVPLLSDGLYPAPPLSNPVLPHTGAGGREKLLYRDYYSSSFAGGRVLQHYSWTPPDDQVYPYGERVGPYLAATGSETAGNAAVFAYEVDTDGGWAGGMIPLVKEADPLDLSSARALSFQARHLGLEPGESIPSGDVTVHLVFGLLPEDLDDDGVLDEESSRYDDGFAFNHLGSAIPVAPVIPWAADRSARDTEDLDGNGLLNDHEVTVVKQSGTDFTLPADGAGWQRIRIPLSPADRESLSAVTAVGIYIEETGGASAAAGRLLIADPSFAGSSFSAYQETSDALSVGSAFLDSGTPEYNELLSFDDAARFNGASPIAVPVSRAEWSYAGPGTETWRTQAYFSPADLRDYSRISFFMRLESNPPDTLRMKITNAAGEGAGVSFSPSFGADGRWHRYTWDLDSGQVSADGTDQGAARLSSGSGFTATRNAADVTRFEIEAETSAGGAINGALEIDELYLHQPETSVNAGGRGSLRWEHPQALLSAGSTPVLHGIRLESRAHAESGPLAAGFSTPGSSRAGSENLLSFRVLQASADLSLNGDLYEQRIYPTGGYAITLPFLQRHLNLEDRYHEGLSGELERTVARGSAAALKGDAGTARTSFDLNWDGDELSRSWKANGTATPPGDFSMSAGLHLGVVNPQPHFSLSGFTSRYSSTYPLYLFSHTTGSAVRRSTEAEASAMLNGEALTLRLADSLNTRTDPAADGSLSGAHTLSTDLAFSTGDGGRDQYSLAYTRSFRHDAPHEGSQNYLSDAEVSWNRAAAQGYFWSGLPILELWSPSTRNSFSENTAPLSTGSYEAEGRAEYSTIPGSTLRHLLLPGYIYLSAARTLQRDQDAVRDTLNLEGSARATALNLFGRFGRYRTFSWYRTEEISHTLSYSTALPLSPGDEQERQHTLTVQQYLELQIAEEQSITWDGRWDLQLPAEAHELKLTAEWRHSSGRITFPNILQLLEEAGKPLVVHRESADLYFATDPEAKERELRPLLRHTTEFLFGETGTIGLSAAIGYMRREAGDGAEALHTFGGELGISADFTF